MIWITGGTLVTQDHNRRVLRADIAIKDGVIAEIRKKAPTGAKRIDATGQVILPGFIQTHVHLCQTLFRNMADDLELLDWLSHKIWPMEAAHTYETLHTSALLGIHELLASGTTCVLDMGTVRHTEAIYEAVKKTGIRANVGKCLMDHPKTTPANLRENTHDAVDEARALYKKWHGAAGDRIRASYAPRFVISCTDKLLSEISRLSREQGALVHTHASENIKEIQLIKKLVNCENIEYLHQLRLTSPRLVLAHCIWLKPGEMQILQKTKTNVVHCPSSNLKLASGLARVPEMLQKGINVSLGADGAPCNNNLNMLQEMRMAALIHKPGAGPRAVCAQEVLDMATRNGAKALNWESEIGSLEVGKKADLIALDLNQPENLAPESPDQIISTIVYSAQPVHIRMTMVDGKVLYKDGKVQGLDKIKLVAAARTAQKQILNQIK